MQLLGFWFQGSCEKPLFCVNAAAFARGFNDRNCPHRRSVWKHQTHLRCCVPAEKPGVGVPTVATWPNIEARVLFLFYTCSVEKPSSPLACGSLPRDPAKS